MDSLLVVCQNGDLDSTKSLIEEQNEDPYQTDEDGVTALHTACMSGNLDLVTYLVSEMALDVNAIGLKNSTPLHFTSSNRIAEFLISKGADPDLVNDLGDKAWTELEEEDTNCTAVTQKKERCKLKCVSGTKFCKRHTTKTAVPTQTENKCSAMTKKKERCKLNCVSGTNFCKRHTEE